MDNEIRRLEALHQDKRFAVVIPLGEVGNGAAAIENFVVKENYPVLIDYHAPPFKNWKAEDYLPGSAGTLQDVVML